MEKIYTRLKINVKSNYGETDGVGCFAQAAKNGALTYKLTITKNGEKYPTNNGKFNEKGESQDYFIPSNGNSVEEARHNIRAYWEVFMDEHRLWFGYAQRFFAYSAQMGSPHRVGQSATAEWSIAKVKVTQTESRLCTNGEVHVTTVKISSCPHKHDGAMDVAEYIVQEIKRNVKSDEGNLIRSYNDEILSAIDGHATALWIAMVAKGQKWDHKDKIRHAFASVAVERPLDSGKRSTTYYHKYKNHDYFVDVWSNIHYGYVGLSVRFDRKYLLVGASGAQIIDSRFKNFDDPIDDVTSIKIGFALYERFGAMAQDLNIQVILDMLEATSMSSFPESQKQHWCLDSRSKG